MNGKVEEEGPQTPNSKDKTCSLKMNLTHYSSTFMKIPMEIIISTTLTSPPSSGWWGSSHACTSLDRTVIIDSLANTTPITAAEY